MSENLLEQTAEDEIMATEKPEGLPEKFWDNEKSEVRMEALLKSYLALEAKMSQKKPIDEPPASSDEYIVNPIINRTY